MTEFSVIERFFKPLGRIAPQGVLEGIGNDAAVLQVPTGKRLVVSTDTLAAGTHFFQDVDAFHVGFKSLAVNISDMAAMGAVPRWYTQALSMPSADEAWLGRFAKGLRACARQYDVCLVGGDTTQGPLSVTIQIMGLVGKRWLTRTVAKQGDGIFVTGQLGGAGLALQRLKAGEAVTPNLAKRLHQPVARVEVGQALAKERLATAAIDVSDGLLADLQHLLRPKKLGAVIELSHLPLHAEIKRLPDHAEALRLALTAGDDYELLFTAPLKFEATLQKLSKRLRCPITRIGQVVAKSGITFEPAVELGLSSLGYKHFSQ